MDLSEVKQNDLHKVILINPITGKPIKDDNKEDMWIEVYGADTKQYRAAMADVARSLVGTEPKDDKEEEVLSLLTGVTANWHIQFNGEHPECTPEAARELYRKQLWIREAVDRAVHNRANFFVMASAS